MDRDVRYLVERIDGLRDRIDRILEGLSNPRPARSNNQPPNLMEALMSQLDQLKDEIRKNRDVTSSAVLLLRDITSRLNSVRTPDDLTEVIDAIKADTDELAQSVAQNTPGAPHNTSPSVANPNAAAQPDETFPASNVPPANRPTPGEPALEPGSSVAAPDPSNPSPDPSVTIGEPVPSAAAEPFPSSPDTSVTDLTLAPADPHVAPSEVPRDADGNPIPQT